jgi:RNA polymerase sigma factor (sigma-70 family)
MGRRQSDTLLRHLRQVLEPQAAGDQSDAELLRRFAGLREEEAFAALMQRHGRLVWAVCRRVLHHEHDAEDAFQGTFLVLARKAGSIRKRQSLGSWLHGVAYRVARKARVAAARRRNHESRAATPPEAKPSSEMAWRELQTILDGELNGLPEKCRAPFVLCCLEGKTKPEAARDLGWKEGTVSSRLAQARNLLQQRLARRGVTLSALLVGTALAHDTASAAVPGPLLVATLRAAPAFAVGPATGPASAEAVALARGTLRALAASRLRFGAALLVLVSAVGAGAGMILHRPGPGGADGDPNSAVPVASAGSAARPEQTPRRGREGNPAPAAEPDQAGEGDDGELTVGGRVVDAAGQPLPGAEVAVVAGEYRQPGELLHGAGPPARAVLGSGHADARGAFQLSLPRTSAQRNYGVALIAASPGHGLGWYALTPGQSRGEFECRLEAGKVVRGRLVDARGNPAARVRFHVAGLNHTAPGSRALRFPEPPAGLHPWPAPVTTDERGQFVLRDVGPDWEIDFQVRDERFAPQWLVLKAGAGPATFSLAPRRTLEGMVTCKDTGRPMANAFLVVQSQDAGAGPLVSRADEQGRFRIAPFPGDDLVIVAYPEESVPYLGLQNKTVHWPRGAATRRADVALPRGVPVRGRVVERPSGRPVPGVAVEYRPRSADNPYVRPEPTGEVADWWSQDARSGPDGTFRLTALPGPGWLVFKGPGTAYVHAEVSARRLECGKAGGVPYFFDAIVPLDVTPAAPEAEVTAELRRGVTRTGQVLAHDGRPAASARLLAPTYIPAGFEVRGDTLPVGGDGRFALPGCDPGQSVPVWFFDPQRQEGAFVELPGGRAADEPVTVRLAPCGTAAVRCLGDGGPPVSRPPLLLGLLLRRGLALQESIDREADAALTVPARRLGDASGATFNPGDGAMTFSCLIPGATYVLTDGHGSPPRASFTVRPGQNVRLPDVLIGRAGGGGTARAGRRNPD